MEIYQKKLLLFLIVALTISCSEKEIQPTYTSLVGSWQMETNNGVDISFEILDCNIGVLLITNFYLSFNGKILNPPESIYLLQPIEIPIDGSHTLSLIHRWIDMGIVHLLRTSM